MQLQSGSVFVVERVMILIVTYITDHAVVRLTLLLLLLLMMMMRVVMMMMVMMTTMMLMRFLDVISLVTNVQLVIGRKVLFAEVVWISVSS